jgi:O-antigen/teichoic acid export membrane protein
MQSTDEPQADQAPRESIPLHPGHENRRFRQGVLFSCIRYGIMMLTGLAYSLVYARILGSETLGTVALLTGILGIFRPFSNLGEHFSLIPALNRYTGQQHQATGVFWTTVTLSTLLTAVLSIPIYILASMILMGVYKRPDLIIPFTIYLAGFYTLGNLVYLVGAPFQAYQRMKRYAGVELINGFSKIALLLLCVQLFGVTPTAVVIALILGYAANLALLILFLPAVLKVRPGPLSLMGLYSDMQGVYRYCMKSLSGNISISLFQHADRLILGYFASPASLGVYSVTYGIFEKILMMGLSYENMVFSSAAKLTAQGAHQIVFPIYFSALRTSFYILLPMVVVIGGLAGMVLSFYGDSFTVGSQALRILLGGVLLDNFSRITLGLMGGVGNPGRKGLIMTVGGLSNLGLNLALIPFFSLNGAAMANALGYLVTSIFCLHWLFGKLRAQENHLAMSFKLIQDLGLLVLLNALISWLLGDDLMSHDWSLEYRIGGLLLLGGIYAWLGKKWVLAPKQQPAVTAVSV